MRGAGRPAGRSMVRAGTPCRPPPIRAGWHRRTPHSACAMTSACSTAIGRPIYGIGAGSHRPAQVGCGRPCPRNGMRHALLAVLASLSVSLRSQPILWFDPRREHSSIPTATRHAAARRACQGWPRLARTPAGLGLDRPEHAGIIDRIGHGGRRDLPQNRLQAPTNPTKRTGPRCAATHAPKRNSNRWNSMKSTPLVTATRMR